MPEELFTGKRVDLSNIRLFGTTVLVHIPTEKRRKWDAKSQKMIFVGFDGNTKGYRCINQTTRKLTISRDVIFHEITPNNTINLIDDINSVREDAAAHQGEPEPFDSSDESEEHESGDTTFEEVPEYATIRSDS